MARKTGEASDSTLASTAERRAAARRAVEYSMRIDPQPRGHEDWEEAAEEAEFWRLQHRAAVNRRYAVPQMPAHDCAEGLLAEIAESERRAPELLLAIRCWIVVARAKPPKSVRKSIEAWLRRECSDLGVREIQRIASVVNWSRKRR